LPFYRAKLLLCRFVTTKFSPLVEFAGVSNAVVTRADCTYIWIIFSPRNIISIALYTILIEEMLVHVIYLLIWKVQLSSESFLPKGYMKC
jgi:hypothetical protein